MRKGALVRLGAPLRAERKPIPLVLRHRGAGISIHSFPGNRFIVCKICAESENLSRGADLYWEKGEFELRVSMQISAHCFCGGTSADT